MLVNTDKSKCCGCGACAQRCSQNSITLHEDKEGFLYPQINMESCIDCGLCERVCPSINQFEPVEPLNTFAARNRNEQQRLCSSSGGIFVLLAEYIIKKGGIVFGAIFDKNWEVKHHGIDSLNQISSLMGSKYVQSRIGNSYKEAELYLKQGKQVMFTGTPCQIVGLKKFLRKEYSNLLTVDIICHGVPSPSIWRDYVSSICKDTEITNINFKDKSTGWSRYSIKINFQNRKQIKERASCNPYMRGFFANLYLRPSCYACSSKNGQSNSDITLGDFWGLKDATEITDDKLGTSLVLVFSQKGIDILEKLDCELIKTDFDKSIAENSCFKQSTNKPLARDLFFEEFTQKGWSVIEKYAPLKRIPIWVKVLQKIKQIHK